MNTTAVIGIGLAAVGAGLAGIAVTGPGAEPRVTIQQPPPDEAVKRPGRIALTGDEIRGANRMGMPRRVSSLLKVDKPLPVGGYRWDDAGVPPGPTWVYVDLKRQLISVFRGEHEIGTAVVLYGAPSRPTPIGTFRILAKMRDHRSRAYDAEMPYTLQLTNDGVSIHGSMVQPGRATHGCIGVPEAFAARLFAVASTGDTVKIVDA